MGFHQLMFITASPTDQQKTLRSGATWSAINVKRKDVEALQYSDWHFMGLK